MTYTPPRREAHIAFEAGHTYHGAEVTLSLDAPASLLFRLQSFPSANGEERAAMVREFGDEVLIAWNLDGAADGDGLLRQPMAFVDQLFESWVEQQGVPAPLVATSPDTSTLAELSTPMDASSGSRRKSQRR